MSAPIQPLRFAWDGEVMKPLSPRQADRQFVIGETYVLAEHLERSSASHRHYFAIVNEAWHNLPEELAERFANPDMLRKWALIKAGFRDERTTVCASKAEAERVAAFIKPIDSYAVVRHHEATVVVWTAQSQSTRAMGKERFQESKDKVLEVLAELIGVEATALSERAAAA